MLYSNILMSLPIPKICLRTTARTLELPDGLKNLHHASQVDILGILDKSEHKVGIL